MKSVIRTLLLLIASACASAGDGAGDVARWEARAAAVTIARDDWGIPHIRGKTDADAVFGFIYAQAEDDFNRIETNYLNALGRLAEAEGDSAIWSDLRMRLFIHPDSMRARYAESPAWLRALTDAWADGLNYYLHTHPAVSPRVITRFESWMPFAFTEGSIGGDIESISLRRLEAFYGEPAGVPTPVASASPGRSALQPAIAEPGGSNAFAIAPSRSASGKALLLINPHTSFFFRAEAQVSSDEGLDAYGATTWGQFFIYQGFNAHLGWMHPTSGADRIDEYAERVVKTADGYAYRYGTEQRPVTTERIGIAYRTVEGIATREFTVFRTHHGPVVREADGRWISVRLMQEPVKALTQSYTRTKATDYASFREAMRLHTNSSNNTIYADAGGHIGYFHGNFVPRRDPRFDWSKPVDGSDPRTEWRGLHSIEESPLVLDPASGWIQNTNNWPYSAAGPGSPREQDFPAYMDRAGENPRGIHAIEVLSRRSDFTLASLIEAAFDPHLTAFDALLPSLLAAYDGLGAAHPLRSRLAGPIGELRGWDRRSSVSSIPTTLAVLWGDELWTATRPAVDADEERLDIYRYMATRATSTQRLAALVAALDRLERDFGDWRTPWGEVNRFQRLTGDIVHPFDDSAPSLPIGFTSARWGSLASFATSSRRGTTKRIYGTSGNSFVAVVEFGERVRARAITAGGESGDPTSRHFKDQASRYATGDLREVYFYPDQLRGHTERRYRPGR